MNYPRNQQELQQRARELAQQVIGPRAAQHDIDQEYPWDNVEDLKQAGFMGMTVPKEFVVKG